MTKFDMFHILVDTVSKCYIELLYVFVTVKRCVAMYRMSWEPQLSYSRVANGEYRDRSNHKSCQHIYLFRARVTVVKTTMRQTRYASLGSHMRAVLSCMRLRNNI